MRRALLAVALCISFIGFASVEGQTKKDPKDTKDTKDTKKVEPAKVGQVEIYKGKQGMRFRIVDAEGKTIAMPPAAKHWETKER